MNSDQAIALIECAAPYVGTWKIGKLNHLHLLEAELRTRVEHIDWRHFVDRLIAVFNSKPSIAYLIKDSLLPYWPADIPSSTLHGEQVRRSRPAAAPSERRQPALTLF